MTVIRTLRRPRVLIVGCGDVGLRCVERLRQRARVFALTTDPERRIPLREAGTIPLTGNLDVRASLARLAGLAPVVLHLVPPQKSGEDDRRTRALIAALTSRQRSVARAVLPGPAVRRTFSTFSILSTRIRPASGTRHAMLSKPPRAPAVLRGKTSGIVPDGSWPPALRRPVGLRIVYASTTGVYGDCGGARIDETRPARPATPRAKRRVAAERLLRQATARGALSATIARIPGIYAADRLPLARLAKGTPALIAADDVYTSHIHADDLASILVRLATHGRPSRVVHASDNSELKMGEYFDRVADTFGVARAPRVSRALAEQQLDPLLLSFMSESRRLSNRRLLHELRVRLRYPSVDDFLRTLPPRP